MASEGFDHLFAMMGDANQDMIVNLGDKHGVKVIEAHHEGNAVGMADGYARFSGKMGLASVTQAGVYQRRVANPLCRYAYYGFRPSP